MSFGFRLKSSIKEQIKYHLNTRSLSSGRLGRFNVTACHVHFVIKIVPITVTTSNSKVEVGPRLRKQLFLATRYGAVSGFVQHKAFTDRFGCGGCPGMFDRAVLALFVLY